jgi:glutaredoxin-like protein NrdH
LLDDKQISYEVVEVDMTKGEDQQQALAEVDKLTGKRSFPVTVIDETVIQGYKVEELERALESEA